MKFLKVIWAFSRPHTIIGSFLSIVSLYAIAIASLPDSEEKIFFLTHYNILFLTIISALGCNLYITGLNQIQDIEIDAINKPWLPIPAGDLSKRNAQILVSISLLISLIAAALANKILLILIVIIAGLGTAYSLPPLKFKKHHLGAAISILLVRGILVNIGMPMQFLYSFTGIASIPASIWPLVFFVVGFSLGIAWFKDIPDTRGDEKYNIKTLAIKISPLMAFRYGIAVVSISYIGLMLIGAFLGIAANEKFFFLSHSILLLLFLLGASKVKLEDEKNLKRFYLGFWAFFFMEYIIYPLAFFL